MNAKLEAISNEATKNLVALLKEAEEDILVAWACAIEEAEANETKPRLKLGYGITIDLEAEAVAYELSFGIRHKLTVCAPLPDPNQPELPLLPKDDPAADDDVDGFRPLDELAKEDPEDE